MSGDGEERDVRDSLGELERRLLDLERELRTGASEDAQAAAGAPAAPPPEPAPPPAPAPAAPPAEPAPPEPEADPEVARLAGEAQRKVAALRESLDGLERASDRLRETAQTVVEDHGRTLVRLDRATAPIAPAPRQEPRAAPPPAPSGTAPVPPAAPPAPPSAPPPPPPSGRRRWTGPVAAAILLAAAALLLLLLLAPWRDATPTRAPERQDRVLVGAELPDLGLRGTSAASEVAAVLAVCSGDAAAAVVTIPAGERSTPPCRSAAVLADLAASAEGVALPVPARGGGRRCVAATAVDGLTTARGAPGPTAARRARIDQAERTASAASRQRGSSRVATVRAVRAAGARAAAAVDRAQRLRLLAVSPVPGGRCIRPTQANLASGAYPLGTRVKVFAAERSVRAQPVQRAAAIVRAAFSGPLPVDATVLRRR